MATSHTANTCTSGKPRNRRTCPPPMVPTPINPRLIRLLGLGRGAPLEFEARINGPANPDTAVVFMNCRREMREELAIEVSFLLRAVRSHVRYLPGVRQG